MNAAISILTIYFKKGSKIMLDIFSGRAVIFASINRISLYLEYMNLINMCSSNTLTNMYAEILNINRSIVSEFLANQSISVPPPLSCVQGLLSSLANTLNSTFNTINETVGNPNPSSNCEPFYGKFMEFERVWYKYFNELRDHAISKTIIFLICTQT